MADEQEGQQLSQQDVKDLQEIASKLPQGHPMVPKISTLLNAQPTQFEKERPSSTWDVVTGPKVPRPPGGGEEAMLAEGAPPALAGLSTIGTAGALKTNPLRAIRGLIGAGVGGSLGERGGRDIGSLFGPTGGQVGGTIGAVGGGLLGGGLASGLERNPATGLQSRRGMPGQIKSLPFGIQRFIPEWMVPKGELGSPTNPGPFSELPERVPKVTTPAAGPELGSPENPGWHAKLPVRMPIPEAAPDQVDIAVKRGIAARIPVRMPKVAPPEPPTPELGSPENPGWHAKLPIRMPEAAPAAQAELGSPENPGWYAKLPTRMPAVKPPEPEPFGNATSTAAPIGRAELPAVPQGNPTPFTLGIKSPRTTATSQTAPEISQLRTGLREGSAGDLASWREDDLWSGYMKNRGTPFGDNLAAEIQRRGLARSPAETVRPSMGRTTSEAPPVTVNERATPLGNKGLEVPKVEGIKLETDSNGTRWAVSGKYRVSIPKTVSDAEAEDYAKPKLKEQAQIHKGIVK